MNNKYDKIFDYYQGIAIVEKNNKYGAIMVGGKEIIPPIYDELSNFDGGIARVKYSYKKQGEIITDERNINLSGQIEVLNNNVPVSLPEEYDWGFDYESDICIVIKNGKYGLIDTRFNVLLDCNYTSFDGFRNGYGIFLNNRKSIIVDQTGSICYEIKQYLPNGYKFVQYPNTDQPLLGIMNNEMSLITSISYRKIQSLNNTYFVTESHEDYLSKCIIGLDGSIINQVKASEITGVNDNYIVIIKDDKSIVDQETCILKNDLTPLLTIPNIVVIKRSDNDNLLFELNNLEYSLDLEGGLYLTRKRIKGVYDWDNKWKEIGPKKVKHEYLKYSHQEFSNDLEIIQDNSYKKGISDSIGNVIIEPQYNYIAYISDSRFIAAVSNKEEKKLRFGVIDKSNKILVPFIYKYLFIINQEYLAYSDNIEYVESAKNEYNVYGLPSFNSTHVDIYYGILDTFGKEISKAIFSNIFISGEKGQEFVVGFTSKKTTLKYGLINSSGKYILNLRYDRITYDRDNDYFVTTLSYSKNSSYEKLSNKVTKDGKFIVKGSNSELVYVSTMIADWCSDFSEEGIALLIKDGFKGNINEQQQIVSLLDNEYTEIPKLYDFACNYSYGYAPVCKHGKYGIIDILKKEIIPCSYTFIEPITPNLFKFKDGEKWGIVDLQNHIKSKAIYSDITGETEKYYKVKLLIQVNNRMENKCGVFDEKGDTIIEAVYDELSSVIVEEKVFWIATSKRMHKWLVNERGLINEKGQLIIAQIFDEIHIVGKEFVCRKYNESNYLDRSLKICLTYNLKGEQVLHIDSGKKLVIPAQYEIAHYANFGLVRVLKNGKWGLINNKGEEIISPSFSYIGSFSDSFALVGISEDSYLDVALEERWQKNLRYGLIDTTGEIVLPMEFEDINKWDNGYYCVKKNGLYGVLSPSLDLVIKPTHLSVEKLDNRFLIVESEFNNYNTWYKLIDYYGNDIIAKDECHKGFQKIELFDNNFLKVFYHISDMHGGSTIAIVNERGKRLCVCSQCDDLQYIGHGLFLVSRFSYTSFEGDGYRTYNIATLQNTELFNKDYKTIDIQDDGTFLIESERGWGFADSLGRIIAQPLYLEKLAFENGLANIEVIGSNEVIKINRLGNVIVNNGEQQVTVPSCYYWASNYVKGISIVRSIYSEKIGVIDEDFNPIISAEYDKVSLLSDDTIIIKEDDCYGLYDIKGKCIFPVIFTSIEYIQTNRIRVCWNLKFAKNWECGTYVPGSEGYKFQGSGADYYINNRSAICDSNGNILNENNIIFVGKFYGKYARTYLNAEIKNDNVKLTQVGVIDVDGKIIIPNKYDEIILYNHNYARVKKESIIGIVDLTTKETHMFEDVKFKRMWNLDKFGRMIFSEDAVYDEEEEKWIATKGVISPKGIIIKPGEYASFYLLDNGLIKVKNEKGQIGLIDSNGEIIQSPIYSYLYFEGEYASVCIGGQRDSENPYLHTGGKWGIIDSHGTVFKECLFDQEQKLPSSDNNDEYELETIPFEKPSVIISDSIPQPSMDNYYDHYYDDDYDNDDGYSKYGGYNGYDDQTIDEAFDGDPSLTWNID